MGWFEGSVTREELLLLAEYDRWATDRLLGVAARLPPAAWTQPVDSRLPCLRDAFVHLVSSAVVWLARWQGRPLATGLRAAAFPSAAALHLRWREVAASLGEFLQGIPEASLRAPFAYRTATGRERSEVLELTFWHLVTHAAHHRGQIITVLRSLGGPTVHTDLLHFLGRRGRDEGR